MKIFNVPSAGPRFWTAISIASVFGANLGDFVSHHLHMGHFRGLPFEALVFAAILLGKRLSKPPGEIWYWLGIVTLRTAATNLADLATHDLRLAYAPVCGGLAVLLLLALLVGDGEVGSFGVQGGAVPPTSARYWLAMLLAGTLGTAAGDGVADALGLGVTNASLLLAAGLAGLFALRSRPGFATGGLYWLTILAVRTTGTTVGDLCAHHLGLVWSTACTGLLFFTVLAVWPAPRAAGGLSLAEV